MSKINATVLMSDALHFRADQAINPYYYDTTVDQTQAVGEHQTIAHLLQQAGIEVVSVPSPSDSQDGVYTANWALVRGDTAILARLPAVRASEEIYAERVLQQLGKRVVRVPDGLKFSGQGDALACGNYLFAGSTYRSDPRAQVFAAQLLDYELVQLQTVPQLAKDGQGVINAVSGWPDSFFYDIDLALSIIKPPLDDQRGLIAYCPEAFTKPSQTKLDQLKHIDKIVVSLDEAQRAFAMNLVSTGDSVVMAAHAPNFRAALEARGLTVYCPEIHELAKGGGYIRCTTLTLD